MGHRGRRPAGQEAGGFVTDYRGADRAFERRRICRRLGGDPFASCRSWSRARSADRSRWSWPPQALHSRRRSLTIDPKHRIVEGVASDGSTIWVSSILDRQILACRSSVPDAGDLARRPASVRDRVGCTAASDCGSRPTARRALPASSRATRRADRARCAATLHASRRSELSSRRCSLRSARGVFVSEPERSGRASPMSGSVRSIPVVKPGVGKSGQGTALSRGQAAIARRRLQPRASASIDLASRQTDHASRARTASRLRGIDGLVRCGSTYYGIYNGIAPGMLVVIAPAENARSFTSAAGDTTLPDPTQIAYDGKRLLIVADSGWATIDKPDFERTAGAPIVAVPLIGGLQAAIRPILRPPRCCGPQFAVLESRQVFEAPRSFPLASVAAGYLPILLFLVVALGLSTGVRRAADDRLAAAPARTSPTRTSSANMNAASRRSRTPAPSSTCASTWSRSCSSSSTSKRRSCSRGRSASTSRSWTGWTRDDDLPGRAWPRPRLCVEEGSARMGVMLSPDEDRMPSEEELARLAGLVPGEVDQQAARGTAAQSLEREGLPGHLDRGSVHLGAHRLAVVDDLRPRLLRGRDDPREHAAL